MKYDVGYNLTEEIRVLLDADHKKDIESFEKAKKHIQLLIGLEDEKDDLKKYTSDKQKLLDDYYNNLDNRMKEKKTEYLIQLLSNDLIAFNEAYNALTVEYMEGKTKELLEYARK
jgi:hypothetical protein